MIIEQAFHILPEILVGARYPTQSYEGGIVVAFSMALLQELNGRNANNPISHMMAEHLYQSELVLKRSTKEMVLLCEEDPFLTDKNTPKYLRADLHVALERLEVGSSALARFGWRHSNWVEAKFFRDAFAKPSSNSTTQLGEMMADLIRLVALPPWQATLVAFGTRAAKHKLFSDKTLPKVVSNRLFTGRYFIHVYQGPPEHYGSLDRSKTKTATPGKRKWLEKLRQAGSHHDVLLDYASEGGSFKGAVGALGNFSCTLSFTNFILGPLYEKTEEDSYHCILTRIDAFSISVDSDKWEVTKDRWSLENEPGAWQRIRQHVGDKLNIKAKPASGVTTEEEEKSQMIPPTSADRRNAVEVLDEFSSPPPPVDWDAPIVEPSPFDEEFDEPDPFDDDFELPEPPSLDE